MKVASHLLKTHLPLHTWCGVVSALFLIVCFLAGALTLFLDDVDRVGRQPLRKLGAQERFIKPLNGMLEYGLPHDATVRAIAAALHYHNPDDPQAVEMQYYRHAHGIAATLAKYSDFTDAAVVAEIEAAYQALA